MNDDFRLGDRIKVRQKGGISWHNARITKIGKTDMGDLWLEYDLDFPVGGFGNYWRNGIHYDSLDPNRENIKLLEVRKRYKLIYDKDNACYRTEQI